MATIQQIYCTHCTFGTSALERKEGELTNRVLGYSARAGSQPRDKLRLSYRQVERYLQYYLPPDTPAEEKLRRTAADTPRRLLCNRVSNGLQLVGQICYRQMDATNKSAGSYFGHVLFSEVKDGKDRWPLRDCLRLWGSSQWVVEDKPVEEMKFELPELASLDKMLDPSPAVSDAALLSFLTTPAGQSFRNDPGKLIPARWKQTSPEQRAGLLTEALAALLAMKGPRRESVLLVVEPSLAALLFYGMARLLPGGDCTAELGFSTYEANPDRLNTTVAATTFHAPESTDLRPEAYRRGYAINTFLDRRTEGRKPEGRYAPALVEMLTEAGPAAVDRLLERFERPRLRLDNLEELLRAHHAVPLVLDVAVAELDWNWRASELASGYLREALAERLTGPADKLPQLKAVLGSRAHLRTLELLAREPVSPETQSAVEYLLDNLPQDKVETFLQMDAIAAECKARVLAHQLTKTSRLPGAWDQLRHGPMTETGRRPGREGSLYPRVLERVSSSVLQRVYEATSRDDVAWFLQSLAGACKSDPSKQEDLDSILGKLNEELLVDLLDKHGTAIWTSCGASLPKLGPKLAKLLDELADERDPERFGQRLRVLGSAREILGPIRADRIVGWEEFHKTLQEQGQSWNSDRSVWQRVLRLRGGRRHDQVARRLAETFVWGTQGKAQVAPAGFHNGDEAPDRDRFLERATALGTLIGLATPQLKDPTEFFNEAVKRKFHKFFALKYWEKGSVREEKLAPPAANAGEAERHGIRLTTGVMAVAAVLGLMVLGFVVFLVLSNGQPIRNGTEIAKGEKPETGPPPDGGTKTLSPDKGGAKSTQGASATSPKQGGDPPEGGREDKQKAGSPKPAETKKESVQPATGDGSKLSAPDTKAAVVPGKEKPIPSAKGTPENPLPAGVRIIKIKVVRLPRLCVGKDAFLQFSLEESTGITGEIRVFCEGLPDKVTAAERKVPPGDKTGELQISAAAGAKTVEDFKVTLVATDGEQRADAEIRLTVLPKMAIKLDLPEVLLLKVGKRDNPLRVKVFRISFSEPVELRFFDLPKGVKIPTTTIEAGSVEATIKVAVEDLATAEDTTIRIEASGGPGGDWKLRTIIDLDPKNIDAWEEAVDKFKDLINLGPRLDPVKEYGKMLDGLKVPRKPRKSKAWEKKLDEAIADLQGQKQNLLPAQVKERLDKKEEYLTGIRAKLRKRQFEEMAMVRDPLREVEAGLTYRATKAVIKTCDHFLTKAYAGTDVAREAEKLKQKLQK